MTETREPFDDFLKRKYDNKDFLFKDEYWLEAEKLLQRKKKRRGFFWIFSIIGIIGLTILGMFTLNQPWNEEITEKTSPKSAILNHTPIEEKMVLEKPVIQKPIPVLKIEEAFKPNGEKSTYKSSLKKTHLKNQFYYLPENSIPKVNISESSEMLTEKIAKKIDLDRTVEGTNDMAVADSVPSVNEKKPSQNLPDSGQKQNKNVPTPKNWMNIFVGTSYNTSISQKPTWSPTVGINMETKLTEKWRAGMGLIYINSGKINITKIYNSKSYNVGVTNYTNTVSTTKLNYIAFPLYLKNNIYKNSWLQAGVNLSFLLSTQNRIRKEEQQDIEAPVVIEYSEPNHKTGLALFDPQLFLSYQYYFKKSWSIETKYFFGILPVASKTHFGVKQLDIYNRGFNLYIHYNFLYN